MPVTSALCAYSLKIYLFSTFIVELLSLCCGRLTQAGCQNSKLITLIFPPQQVRGEKQDGKIPGSRLKNSQVKTNAGRSLTKYCHRHKTQLGESKFNLLPFKTDFHNEKKRQN